LSIASVTVGLIAPGVQLGSGIYFALSAFILQMLDGGKFTAWIGWEAFWLILNCAQVVGVLLRSVSIWL
jgi:hypothetical protein